MRGGRLLGRARSALSPLPMGGMRLDVVGCPRCEQSGNTAEGTCPTCEGKGSLAVSALERAIISICMIPTKWDPDRGELTTCGTPHFRGEERKVAQHTALCAKRHADVIRAYREHTHPDIMRPWDPERARWNKENAAAILDGRMTN